jgi:hypothetical protein
MNRIFGAVLIFTVALGAGLSPALLAAQTHVPVHHEATATINPESRQLTVTDRITVKGRKKIAFRVAPWLTVQSISLNGRPLSPPAMPSTWQTTLPDQGPHRIDMRLTGTVPELKSARRGAIGMRAALGPDGGYLFDGAGWFPETGDERITYRLRVEVPSPWRAVATGRLSEETSSAESYGATFTADISSAPPALFLGTYDIRERQHGDIRIRTYFQDAQNNLSNVYLTDSAQYLSRYRKEIGPYPYRDFHIIAAPIPVGLGFPNLTYIGSRILPLPFIRTRSLAHEVLHNWWGNGVTVDYRKGNWAEGLTTYMADYALADEKDANLGRNMRLSWLRDYAALPVARDIPVNMFTAKHDDAAQVVGYNKVAFIFHMLKLELGEATFKTGLRLFWQQRQNKTAGWEDLQRAFETVSGRDLKLFFRQWLTKAGAPRLSLENVALEPLSADNTYQLQFTIRQSLPAYRLTIPVVIETKTGPRHIQIKTTGAQTAVDLTLDMRPTALHIDRHYDVFRRLARGETPYILRDVTLASRPVTVIASKDKALAAIARQLANRLLKEGARLQPASSPTLKRTPHVIIGSTKDVKSFLARHRLPETPAMLAGRGTARVWTAYGPGDHPTLIIEAENADALQALLRPLPHYRSRSYVLFNGRHAIDKGTWPVTNSPLSHRFN